MAIIKVRIPTLVLFLTDHLVKPNSLITSLFLFVFSWSIIFSLSKIVGIFVLLFGQLYFKTIRHISKALIYKQFASFKSFFYQSLIVVSDAPFYIDLSGSRRIAFVMHNIYICTAIVVLNQIGGDDNGVLFYEVAYFDHCQLIRPYMVFYCFRQFYFHFKSPIFLVDHPSY